MGDFEDLFGALAEFIDLALYSHLFDWISDALNVDHSFICEGVEKVEGFDCLLSSLFEAKDEINPLVEMIRDILRFESCTIDLEIYFRIFFGPEGDFHVSYSLLILSNSQV